MGKIKKGILGGFSGKVGNVVGGSWKGIDWMRSEPQEYNNPKTPKQQAQRSKFGVCSDFARGVIPAINIGLRSLAVKKTPFNVLISKCCKDYWNTERNSINYSAVKLSAGSLHGTNSFSVNLNDSDPDNPFLSFVWGYDGGNVDDGVVGCAYHVGSESWFIYANSGNIVREDENLTIQVPVGYALDEFYFFLFFVSSDNNDCSDTMFYTEFV